MKTAVIYARYSSASQTEQSIEGQLHVCNQFAKANDLIVVDTYIDRAMTGTNDNRAAFQRMLADSASAIWEVVLVYAIDRFGRNSVEVALNKQRLKSNNKILISATQRTSENLDGTKNLDGILLENVYIGIAEYYSAELSQKIRRGLKESRSKGLFCGGKVPFGYKVVDRRFRIDKDDAELVKYIFERYHAGVYVSDIVKTLNDKGLTNRGKKFTSNMVYGILRNERYTGSCEIAGERYDNIFPQIVDAKLFEAARAKIEKNSLGSRSVQAVYLLRNKVKCGYCGRPISAETGTSCKGNVMRYYKCLGVKKDHNGCPSVPLRKDYLENLVTECVISEMSKPEVLDRLVKTLLQVQDRQTKENTALSLLIKERKKTQTALDNIVSAIERGIISETTNKRLHELETKLRECEEMIAIEKSREKIKLTEYEIRRYYALALKQEIALAINFLVKEIIVFKDKIEIIFNSPLNGPDENRDHCFYEQFRYISVTAFAQYQTDKRAILVKMSV